jgi:hypothetical protein
VLRKLRARGRLAAQAVELERGRAAGPLEAVAVAHERLEAGQGAGILAARQPAQKVDLEGGELMAAPEAGDELVEGQLLGRVGRPAAAAVGAGEGGEAVAGGGRRRGLGALGAGRGGVGEAGLRHRFLTRGTEGAPPPSIGS